MNLFNKKYMLKVVVEKANLLPSEGSLKIDYVLGAVDNDSEMQS